MNKLNKIKMSLLALMLCLSLPLASCGNSGDSHKNGVIQSEQNENSSSKGEKIIIDYGDAESFEAALNEGKNLEGKVVRFVAGEFHPQSKLGYNIWAGEHLNFVSSRNPDIQEGDTVTVRITTIENLLGSWIIDYEKVDNGIVNKDTITYSKPKETTAAATEKPKTTTKVKETEKDESKTETSVSDEPAEENTYEHNKYYDIVETASFQNSIGHDIIIQKILAKENATISGTLLAYAEDGSVIGKSSDDIVLTKGQYNFFRYSFENDISNASIQTNAKTKNDSFMAGERNAVEMVQYNQTGDNLYITFEQISDEMGTLAKFKLLFYKDDQIVDTKDCFFSTYAENLDGKGYIDVAEIWTYDIDFDRIEYVFDHKTLFINYQTKLHIYSWTILFVQ